MALFKATGRIGGSPDRTLKKKARLFFKNDFTCARIIPVGTSLLFNRCGAFSAR